MTLSAITLLGSAAVFSTSATGIVNIGNSTLNNNAASPSGGGIFNNDTGTVNVTNKHYQRNSASAGGGIFNVQNGPINITNSTIHRQHWNRPERRRWWHL